MKKDQGKKNHAIDEHTKLKCKINSNKTGGGVFTFNLFYHHKYMKFIVIGSLL